uniref:Uncharacterized protein n=1 Tax=Tetraselmis sp. GSL018 TaxID=582737 RepID=A0A061SMP8_9CHLO
MSGQLLYCNANELPKSLKEMEKELLCRYRVKELDTRFDRAISQARSPYSFMRERALLQLCGTLLQASVVGVAFESLKRFEAGGASQSGPLTAEGLRDGEEEAAIRALEVHPFPTHTRTHSREPFPLLPPSAPALPG